LKRIRHLCKPCKSVLRIMRILNGRAKAYDCCVAAARLVPPPPPYTVGLSLGGRPQACPLIFCLRRYLNNHAKGFAQASDL
jgi:hypothetical protein